MRVTRIVQEVLTHFLKCVVKKLITFRKTYKSAFLVRFVVFVMLHICFGRVPRFHGFGTEMPGMQPNIGLLKKETS